MKIDIITCHTPQNYGAMLQAYALQTYIESQGPNVEIINYAPDIFFEELRLSYIGNQKIKKSPLLSLCYLIYKLPSRLIRRIRFENFKKKYLHITEQRYESLERLYHDTPVADQYICGSDQIWNTKGIRGYNPAFYLGFVNDIRKRNSYAASMSVDFPLNERIKGDVLGFINNLDMISVREIETARQIQPYVSKEVTHVLDPVYLLTAKEWGTLINGSKFKKEKYILVYPMGEKSITIKNAVILSQKTGLPIYCISASQRKTPGIKRNFMPSVNHFLELIQYASYVITDSFHGTSFSIIFRKNFWSCQVGHNNHRITSILELFNLTDRYIDEQHLIDDSQLVVDYNKATKAIGESIEHSKEFLLSIINKA